MNPPLTPNLYQSFLTPEERQALQSTTWDDLSGEINLLRSAVARFLAAARSSSPSGELELTDANLNTLSLAFGGLASLVNSHMQSHIPLASIEEERAEGLRLARLELGLLPSSESPAGGSGPEERNSDDTA